MARAFLEAGATVVAPARSPASQFRVQAELGELPGALDGRLHVPLADWGSLAGAAELGRYVEQLGGSDAGRADHVVSIAGGACAGLANDAAGALDSRALCGACGRPSLAAQRALACRADNRPAISPQAWRRRAR